MSKKSVSEQDILKITTFEEWVHKHVDRSIEFCNDCPINENDCLIACPYRDALFIHLSDLKALLQQEREPIAQDMKKCPNFGDGAVLGFIDKLLEKLNK